MSASPVLPIDDFVKRGQYQSPVLAPDGRHLVVTAIIQQEGKDLPLILVYDLATMAITAKVRLPVYEQAVHYTWITNTRLVVAVGREFGSLERPRATGEILAMDIDGTHQQYLYGRNMFSRSKRGEAIGDDHGFGASVHVPDSMDGHFLLTEWLWSATAKASSSRLLDINSVTGTRRQVTEIDQVRFDFLVQSDGMPRFAFGADDQFNLAVFQFNESLHDWRPIADKGQSSIAPLALLPGGNAFIATVSQRGGPRSLIEQRGNEGERITLFGPTIGNVDDIEWGPWPPRPFAAGTLVDAPDLHYLVETSPEASLHKLLGSKFPGSRVHFINFSNDGRTLLFSVYSDRDQGAYYLFEQASGKASFLFADRSWIEPEQMASRRAIHFNASDGLELHGYLTLPKGREATSLPLVLLPHGGPHGIADDWAFDTDAQFLASRGYAVLQVNFRGSGGRGPRFENAGYRHWGDRIQDDLLDGVRWAIGEGIVDRNRVCAYGGSFGAYSALMTAARAPELIKCAVGYSGLYDLALLYDEAETKNDKQVFNYWVKVVGQDPAELARNSPTHLADKLHLPVLLVHGSADERTPPVQAESMRDALKKAGNPPEWMFVDGEGHGFYAEKNRKAFYEKLEAFLNKYIGPK